MNFIKIILLLTLTLGHAWYAHAENIIIRPTKTDYGAKVYLHNLKSDFTITYRDSLLTITFTEDMEYEDLGTLSKVTNLVNNIVPQHTALNIFLKNNDITVDKFIEDGLYGFNIRDPNLKTNLQEDADRKVNINDVNVTFDSTDNALKVKFDWSGDVGSAVYERDGRLWIVFNANAKLKIQKFQDISNATQLFLSPDSTFFVMDLDKKIKFSNIVSYKENNKWIVELSDKDIKPHGIPVISKPHAAPEPRVEIEFNSEAISPIKYTDPYVGDNIIALPALNSSFAVNLDYSFVDFKVKKSRQGAFIEIHADSVEAVPKNKFIHIKGLNIIAPKVNHKATEKVDNADLTLKDRAKNARSILDLKKYYKMGKAFLEKEALMWNEIRIAESDERRYIAYTNLAQFYLANDFDKEARIVLNLLKQENEDFTTSYIIQIIRTASYFRSHNFAKAYEIARSIDVIDVPIHLRKEVRFWQTITSYASNNNDIFLNQIDPLPLYISDTNSFISEYTDFFKVEFGLAIAAYKIKQKDSPNAKTILDNLIKVNSEYSNPNQLALVMAEYFALKLNKTKAIEQWDKCIDDMRDQMHRARCMFSKAHFMYKMDEIDKSEYVKQLESVALIWRGDELEVVTLKELGEIYYQLKDYINAMRSWKKIIDHFAFSPDALGLSRKVGETFINFFTKGMDEDVSHMQAAAIFYEFENLIPIGDIGDKIVMRFAEHLIALDLLDKAEALIKHQVLHRLKGYKKEIAINTLAHIYLASGHPELAIEIIEGGDLIDELPDDIAAHRKYLLATSYFENEQDKRALELLDGDLSEKADDIKSDIFWKRRDWKEFNKYIEPRIYRIRNSKDELSSYDAIKVLKLTISYLIQDERKLAIMLLKDFKSRMPKDDINTEFMKILGDTYNIINDNGIEALRNLSAIEAQVMRLIEFLKKASDNKQTS